MDLGRFSLSLAVKDIKASRAFYQKLGFEVYDDHEKDNWMILQCGDIFLGLFQGMFDKNTLTFNPKDVRGIQQAIKKSGLKPVMEADEMTSGPAHCVLIDPDGNPVLLDQHETSYQPTKGG
ncbi:MAG TPA: VOC family protein [Gemmataceae bacterium]|nr:VOC family protein [Gemmataceae bacterium]